MTTGFVITLPREECIVDCLYCGLPRPNPVDYMLCGVMELCVYQSRVNTIIDFPNLGITYNGGWCSATMTR